MKIGTPIFVLLFAAPMVFGSTFLPYREAGAADATTGSSTAQVNLPGQPGMAGIRARGVPPVKGQGTGGSESQDGSQTGPAGTQATRQPPVIAVTKDNRIDADIRAYPLNEALRAMAAKRLFDITGPLPSGEEITVQLSGVTLDEALKKLMRGYNYVLMDKGPSQRPVLMLVGKIQRGASTPSSSQPAQAEPLAANPPVPAQNPPAGPQAAIPPQPVSLNRRAAPNVPAGNAAGPGAATNPGPAGPQGAQPSAVPPVVVQAADAGTGPEGSVRPTVQAQPAPQGGQGQAQTQPQGQADSGGPNPRDLPTSSFPQGESTGTSF